MFTFIYIFKGKMNYSSIAPPNSFIDVSDFDSVSDLAQYLESVVKNKTLYRSYFHWKKRFKVNHGLTWVR